MDNMNNPFSDFMKEDTTEELQKKVMVDKFNRVMLNGIVELIPSQTGFGGGMKNAIRYMLDQGVPSDIIMETLRLIVEGITHEDDQN